VSSQPHALAAGVLLLAVAFAPAALAAPIAPGYFVSELAPDVTGDVAVGGGALFVGTGSFGAGTMSIVRIQGGVTTTIVTGLNAIAGLAYDADSDQLFFGDNGGNFPGATTGDALYALAGATTATTATAASALRITADGALPGVADLVLDPTLPAGDGLFATDASSSFPPAGLLAAVDGATGAVSTLVSGLEFAAGLAVDGDILYVGDALLAGGGRVSTLGIAGNSAPFSLLTTLPGGVFDLEVMADGALVASSGGTLVRIDPVSGAVSTFATGFAFATGLFVDGADVYALEGGLGTNPLYRFTPVPEPASGALLSVGLLALGARRRGASRIGPRRPRSAC